MSRQTSFLPSISPCAMPSRYCLLCVVLSLVALSEATILPWRWLDSCPSPTSLRSAPGARASSARRCAQVQILVLSDLHYGENAAKDELSGKLQRAALSHALWDFVVLGGDQISQLDHASQGESCFGAPPNGLNSRNDAVKNCWRSALEPVARSGIPFATIIGNHDDGPYVSAIDLVAGECQILADSGLLKDARLCLTTAARRRIAFVAPESKHLFSADEPIAPHVILELFHTVDVREHSVWYRGYSNVRAEDIVPRARASAMSAASLTFLHVPLPAIRHALRTSVLRSPSEVSLEEVTSERWRLTKWTGWANESVCCQLEDTMAHRRLFEYLQADPSPSRTIVSGHDHGNAFAATFLNHATHRELHLVQARKSGFGGYNSPNADPSLQGFTAVTVHLHFSEPFKPSKSIPDAVITKVDFFTVDLHGTVRRHGQDATWTPAPSPSGAQTDVASYRRFIHESILASSECCGTLDYRSARIYGGFGVVVVFIACFAVILNRLRRRKRPSPSSHRAVASASLLRMGKLNNV